MTLLFKVRHAAELNFTLAITPSLTARWKVHIGPETQVHMLLRGLHLPCGVCGLPASAKETSILLS